MKRIICSMAVMLLMSITAMAQSYVGKWQAPQYSVEEAFGKGADMTITFDKEGTFSVGLKTILDFDLEGMKIKLDLALRVPGVYEDLGNGKMKLTPAKALVDKFNVSFPGMDDKQAAQMKTIVESQKDDLIDESVTKILTKQFKGKFKYSVSGDVLSFADMFFTRTK